MSVKRFANDTGQVLAAWTVALALEHAFIGITKRAELAGAWELWPARTAAAPIFLGACLVLAIASVGVARLDALADRRPVHAFAFAVGAAVGWSVGTGRHFANPVLRALLAVFVGCAAVIVFYTFRRVKARAPEAVVNGALVLVATAAWWLDGHVLVRLYPAFHVGLALVTLGALAFAAIDAQLLGRRASIGVVALSIACAAYAPFAARRLRSYDNLRRVLVESAPLMGRAVRLATALAPREPDDTSSLALTGMPRAARRALDWSNRDIVLVSIDALRADHVGAYGYARPTTPHIDALAREGTRFDHAYCPTPHTSYSVTSMMTGKYVRPLLALGLGRDSETLASHLRRYGYRTGAFYPPAVFFIDEAKFDSFESRALDFEYRKVEFADPALRESQVRDYLATASTDKPLFLWVHFFEPHEPYVQHPAHPFGDSDVDAYDSEVAEADEGVGRVVSAVRASRPNAVVIVTADHGEEFGDHGGRYHGTTVYEEQVRVPLVVVGPGVRASVHVDVPVQTIDLVPTVLSAEGIPRPARVRGRDLGVLLAEATHADDEGFAFAETDDFSLLAKRSLRLVCQKQADACALFDVTTDAREKHDVSRDRRADVDAMRAQLDAMERSHGRFEGEGASLPDALRRGAAGDVNAAQEVAGLLDDVNVEYRREAARVLFDLKSAAPIAQLRHARDRDDDEAVKGTCEAAIVRVDPSADPSRARALLSSGDVELRRRAALALAERGNGEGAGELEAWVSAPGVEYARQREIVFALASSKPKSATHALVALLDDVRLRGEAADALGKLGDPAARAPLLEHFANERYVGVRPREANALIALGASKDLRRAACEIRRAPRAHDQCARHRASRGPPRESGREARRTRRRAATRRAPRRSITRRSRHRRRQAHRARRRNRALGGHSRAWRDRRNHGERAKPRRVAHPSFAPRPFLTRLHRAVPDEEEKKKEEPKTPEADSKTESEAESGSETESETGSESDAEAEAGVEDIAKRVDALGEEDDLEKIAREEEEKLAARRLKQRGGKKKGLEASASKRLAKIGEKAKPKRAVPDAVEAADPLIERTQQLREWARKNRNIVQGAIVLAVAGAIGFGVWTYLDRKTSIEASVSLAQAVADERGIIGDPDKEDDDAIHEKIPIFKTTDDRREAALAKYREVSSKYKGTGAAWLARLGEGALLLDKRDADGAITAFNDVLGSSLAKADPEVRGRALESLGYAYELRASLKPEEKDKNLDAALEQYKLLEATDVLGFKQMAPYHEARCYELKGDKVKAIELLKALREDLMKNPDARLFAELKELDEDRLRRLDPASVPPKRAQLGAGGGQISPEVLEKLPPELRERVLKNLGGGGGAPE